MSEPRVSPDELKAWGDAAERAIALGFEPTGDERLALDLRDSHAQLAAAEQRMEAILQQARVWAMEAKAQRATVQGVGSALGGIPDWGAIESGVRAKLDALAAAEARVRELEAERDRLLSHLETIECLTRTEVDGEAAYHIGGAQAELALEGSNRPLERAAEQLAAAEKRAAEAEAAFVAQCADVERAEQRALEAETECEQMRERCAECVDAELAKLKGRWSLDSAYLSQAATAIRTLERP